MVAISVTLIQKTGMDRGCNFRYNDIKNENGLWSQFPLQ